jgi:hypothetical protein
VEFDWTRSETIALAKESCTQCQGIGLRSTNNKGGPDAPCNCVLRGIFRACFLRFRRCAQKEKHMSHVRLEVLPGGGGRRQVWGRRDEEYIADFCLVSERYLDAADYKIFRFHYLLGADWKLCCRQLKMDRGSFFHAIYRIQQTLGRIFRELQPYALFPLDEYFGGSVRKELSPAASNLLRMPMKVSRRRLEPPIRKVA